MEYNSIITCKEVSELNIWVQAEMLSDSQDVSALLENVGFPKKYRKDITAAIVFIEEGDYIAVFLSESGRFYDLSSWYHPLPYYLTSRMGYKKYNLPVYWQKSNPFYHK